MTELNKNKAIVELEKATSRKFGKLTKDFFNIGKALYEIKQNKLFNLENSRASFSGFCKKYAGLPGNSEESKRLLAFQMVKIYMELHLKRDLNRQNIMELGFNKAYDLSRFSSTHKDNEFSFMYEEAKKPNSNKFRMLLTNQHAGAVRKEITTAYYDSKGKMVSSNRRIVELKQHPQME